MAVRRAAAEQVVLPDELTERRGPHPGGKREIAGGDHRLPARRRFL
jgi:hypothetical protein